MNDLGWWKFHRKIEESDTWKRLNPFGRDTMIAILNNVDYKTGEWTTNLPDIKNHLHDDTGIQSIRTALKIMTETGFIKDELTGSRQRKITVINWLFYQQQNGANTPQQAKPDLLTAKLTGYLTGKITEKDIINAVLFYKNDLLLTGCLTGELTDKWLEANRIIIKGLKAFKEVKKRKKIKDICSEKISTAITLNTETWEWINLSEEKIIEYQNKYYHADVRSVLDDMIEKAKVGAMNHVKSWGGTIITYLSNSHKWNKEEATKKGIKPKDYRISGITNKPSDPVEIPDDGPVYPVIKRILTPEQREHNRKIAWARQIRGGRHLPDGDPYYGDFKIKPEELAAALDWYHNQGGRDYDLPFLKQLDEKQGEA